MSLRRSLRARAGRDDPPAKVSNTSTRLTRQTRSVLSPPSVIVVRTRSESPESDRKSIHITVKMPPSKLREATGGSSRSAASRRSHNVFTDNPILSGPRTSRSKRRVVEVETSEEEEEDLEDQEEDEVDDEDAPGEDDEDEEDEDADGDVDMDDAPPQPPVSRRNAKATAASASIRKPAKSVEAKEMELDEEEEEDEEDEEEEADLSEPDSDADGEPDDQDEGVTITLNDGEEPDEDEEDDEDLDSEDGIPGDTSKMTKRQRGNLGNDFLQLPMGQFYCFSVVYL